MSAPNTNLQKETRRHRGPLVGMAVVVALALALLFALMMRTADEGTPPDGSDVQIDGRTGDEVVPD